MLCSFGVRFRITYNGPMHILLVETAQILHRDTGFNLIQNTAPTTTCATMWAPTDFTRKIGAPCLVPGSRLRQDSRSPVESELVRAAICQMSQSLSLRLPLRMTHKVSHAIVTVFGETNEIVSHNPTSRLLTFSYTAFADLQYCNRTNIELFAAVGEYFDADYVSTGWFRLASDRCRIVLRKKLDRDEYWASQSTRTRTTRQEVTKSFALSEERHSISWTEVTVVRVIGVRRTFTNFEHTTMRIIALIFLGAAGDMSADIDTDSTLDNDRSGGPENRVGGGSCTQSTIQMCGDPSGHVYATVTVPNLSSAKVRNDVISD